MSLRSTVVIAIATLASTLGADALLAQGAAPTYDVIIRHGMVYDGSGRVPRAVDVAILGDSIAAIGDLSAAHARLEVDAQGRAVAPGFINMLSGSEETLLADGRSESDIRQGVTLEVFGEGGSMGPLSESMKKEWVESEADIKYPVTWTTLDEFLRSLEQKGVSTNVASFVGATTVRIHELGYADRPPTAAELAQMQELVRGAMRDGALGVGSSLIYAPAFYAKTDELVALSRAAGEYGGMYISHMRSEGNAVFDAVNELITIAREAQVPAEIYHLKVAGKENWWKLDSVIAMVAHANASGLKVTANMYTYIAGATGLDASMPPWVQEGGYKQWAARLADPTTRARVKKEMSTPTSQWENLYLGVGSPDRILLIGFKADSLKYLTGKTLAQVAKMRGTSPEETAMDLVIQDGSRVGTVYFLMDENNVRRETALPWVSFGSDEASLAPEGVFLLQSNHPRAFGNFARFLGKYVRDEKVVPLEEAVRRLAALPAANLRIRRRGMLVPGNYADLVIFDPATIQDHATFEKPQVYSTGVSDVFVNGVQVIKGGEHTGALPGRVVRGPGWTGWHARAVLDSTEGAYQSVRALKDGMDIARARQVGVVESGDSLAVVARAYPAARQRLEALLAAVDSTLLDSVERRALRTMRLTASTELASEGATAEVPDTARPNCKYNAAAIAALPNGYDSLSRRVYRCYGYAAQHVAYKGQMLDRLTILGRLPGTASAKERRQLFLALEPVFRSMNGDDGSSSPYRQLVRLSAARWRTRGSPVDEAARQAGVDPAQMERWLIAILSRWRDVTKDSLIEPWDYDYLAGSAERQLDARVTELGLAALNAAYYRSLGADVESLEVRYDLAPREGKTPVAYTTFGRRARRTDDGWARGDEWIFATYKYGGLGNLSELLHESGHAVHIAAIRTRPAFLDWPDDDAFTEGLADIAALEVDEPAWQMRWLGDSASTADNLRARYAAIMMDVCWSLFEIRMHANPDADPNTVWTQLTSKYLHIRPHPDLSWWARRGQLVDLPGYMSNYAIGAIIIADLRARLIAEHGSFSAGDSTWYSWVAPRLYAFGLARSSRQVIEAFLGRPLSPDALLADLARLRPAKSAGVTPD